MNDLDSPAPDDEPRATPAEEQIGAWLRATPEDFDPAHRERAVATALAAHSAAAPVVDLSTRRTTRAGRRPAVVGIAAAVLLIVAILGVLVSLGTRPDRGANVALDSPRMARRESASTDRAKAGPAQAGTAPVTGDAMDESTDDAAGAATGAGSPAAPTTTVATGAGENSEGTEGIPFLGSFSDPAAARRQLSLSTTAANGSEPEPEAVRSCRRQLLAADQRASAWLRIGGRDVVVASGSAGEVASGNAMLFFDAAECRPLD